MKTAKLLIGILIAAICILTNCAAPKHYAGTQKKMTGEHLQRMQCIKY